MLPFAPKRLPFVFPLQHERKGSYKSWQCHKLKKVGKMKGRPSSLFTRSFTLTLLNEKLLILIFRVGRATVLRSTCFSRLRDTAAHKSNVFFVRNVKLKLILTAFFCQTKRPGGTAGSIFPPEPRIVTRKAPQAGDGSQAVGRKATKVKEPSKVHRVAQRLLKPSWRHVGRRFGWRRCPLVPCTLPLMNIAPKMLVVASLQLLVSAIMTSLATNCLLGGEFIETRTEDCFLISFLPSVVVSPALVYLLVLNLAGRKTISFVPTAPKLLAVSCLIILSYSDPFMA